MELNIAIVDDTLSDSVRLKSFIQSWFSENYAPNSLQLGRVECYSSGEECLKNFEPRMLNIVFMDILMDKINGVETAKQLRTFDTELLIVFMTTSREFAFDAFPVHPFDYILKPYSRKNVNDVLTEAARVLTAYEPAIKIKVSHSEYEIPVRLISSLISQGHGVEINLADGKCLLSNMTFKEVEKVCAEHKNFLVCNRGIIVNMSQISAQEKGVFIMKNGSRYPIRVNGQSKVTAAFSQYLIANMRARI